ncbi:MAG TPA: hypothetical protein VLT36_20970 [Candidatus Dormibacteraeota bacterium]|nr:hypothetical protein [Candidatus Dormibacteraeota bacterium]
MNRFSKVLATLAVVGAIVAIGLALGWWGSLHGRNGSQPSDQAHINDSQSTAQTPGNTPRTKPTPKPRPQPQPEQSATNQTPPAAAIVPATQTPAPANLITNWEEKVDAILVSDGEDADKAKQMLEMFPHLAPDAQEEVAHHLSNLTPDENYGPLGSYLTNSTLPEAVLDVLLEDVLNRPNAIKLPMLLEVARDPQNPKAGEAKDVLELFLEEDYGSDWTKWQAKMDEWLKDNPD